VVGGGSQCAAAIHHPRPDAFDRFPFPFRTDAVIPLGDSHIPVIEQGGEHVDWGADVGVSLGVGVAQGVGDHVTAVDDTVVARRCPQQRRQLVDRVDPGAEDDPECGRLEMVVRLRFTQIELRN